MRILSAVKQSRLTRVGLIGVVVAAGAVGLSACWSPAPCGTHQASFTGFSQFSRNPSTVTGATAAITWSPPAGFCSGDTTQHNGSFAWSMVAGHRTDNSHLWYAQVGIEDYPDLETLVGHPCYFAEWDDDSTGTLPSDGNFHRVDVCNNPNPAGVAHQFRVEPQPARGNVLGMFVDGVEIFESTIVPNTGVFQGTEAQWNTETHYNETAVPGVQNAPLVVDQPAYKSSTTGLYTGITDSDGAWNTTHPGGQITDTLATNHSFGVYQN